MQVPIRLNKALEQTLSYHNIEPAMYKPAYNGESVALDLYHSGSEPIQILPASVHSTSSTDLTTRHKIMLMRSKTLIPTGLFIALPKGYAALLRERGSITKTPLVLRAGVIDPGYTGEIFVNMINVSNVPYVIEAHQKLPVQLLVVPVVNDFHIVSEEEYSELVSSASRLGGKIGSSDLSE